MSNNNQSNKLIKWIVIVGDFVLLNLLLTAFYGFSPLFEGWTGDAMKIFMLLSNFAMALAQMQFSTIIHERVVNAGDILRRVVLLIITQTVVAYLLLKGFDLSADVLRTGHHGSANASG